MRKKVSSRVAKNIKKIQPAAGGLKKTFTKLAKPFAKKAAKKAGRVITDTKSNSAFLKRTFSGHEKAARAAAARRARGGGGSW